MRRSLEELRLAIWGAIAFGALLASYSIFRPVRDSLILDGNPDQIPWLWTGTLIAMLIVSPLWSALLARYGRRRLVPRSFHVFAACALVFCGLVSSSLDPVIVGRVFYIWSSVFNLFVVSVLWSLFADLMGPDTARRLYGPIAAGGTIGTFVGPLLTRLLVEHIGVAGVLVMSAVLLELAVVAVGFVRSLGEKLDRESPEGDPPAGGGALDGLVQVARSPYLLGIAGYVLCVTVAATFLYLEQAQITSAAFPRPPKGSPKELVDAMREARTAFFANIDLWISGVTFVLQTLVATRLLRWFGPGIVLMILPVVQVFGVTLLALEPTLTALVIAQVAARSATHGLTRPGRELLFTVVLRDEKYRAKNVIDTVVYRFGDVASSWLYTAIEGSGAMALAIATYPLAAIWIALAALAGVGFRRRLAKKEKT
ncbi:MAG TPA: MFS transporter [Kofleriaceae bacterium]